ncbi:hypothetical protein H312_02150 [Anncaliia algerae PRA339]|uniref:Sulfhydryl oxidase n=1 Tax=Anncaliia algerae PRA339 TaxID=1288291 RepID=A0A059F0B0_9MICR|nr:hypothetical protein H312_02150 [Anncaliia algerae PRA339]
MKANKSSFLLKYLLVTFLIALIAALLLSEPKEYLARFRRKLYNEAYDYRRKNTEREYRDELGRSTWALLHIMAAKYPEVPTETEKKDVNDFIFLLAKVFPCLECKVHFSRMLTHFPPILDNRDSFVKWICETHNRVNIRLNKPVFDCRRHNDKWDCGCN